MISSQYLLHGVDVEVISNDDEVAAMVDNRLRPFRTEAANKAPAEIVFSFSSGDGSLVQPDRPAGSGRRIYDPPEGQVLYFEASDQLYLQTRRVIVLADLSKGRVDTWFSRGDPAARWLAAHPFLTLTLVELLKRRGRYSLHAAACCIDGRVVLLAGESGAGKSTLALAMVRAGAGFLGDDTVFLSPHPSGIEVLAFPDEVDLSDATAGMFPELSYLCGQPKVPGASKHCVRAEDIFGDVVVMTGRPAVLVFPNVGGGPVSRLTEITSADALLQLVPNVLLTERHGTQAHLDMLGELARSHPSFSLVSGHDIGEIPAILKGLV